MIQGDPPHPEYPRPMLIFIRGMTWSTRYCEARANVTDLIIRRDAVWHPQRPLNEDTRRSFSCRSTIFIPSRHYPAVVHSTSLAFSLFSPAHDCFASAREATGSAYFEARGPIKSEPAPSHCSSDAKWTPAVNWSFDARHVCVRMNLSIINFSRTISA